MAQYGSYSYASPEDRALGSITAESYDKDQAKNLIKLNNDVGYMAAYMRKMQKGIDDANQNIIQQLQSFVNDIVVILGGGDSQGLDLGDLKYVLQMIGAMLGFNTAGGIGGLLPLNAFTAIWHMLSTYIFPTDQFIDLIASLFDMLLATLLDLFGDVPIVGEALQQLAVILTTLRDSFAPIQDALNRMFAAFGGTVDWINGEFGALFDSVFSALVAFFTVITGPIVSALTPILTIISGWTEPFTNTLIYIIDVVTNMIRGITGGLDFTDLTNENYNPITWLVHIVGNLINNGVLGIQSALSAFNIFGILPQFSLPNIDISHLIFGGSSTSIGPNLLVEPGFDDADSINIGTGWIRDATVGHTTVGSAKATGGGVVRELESIPIPVVEGQVVKTGAWLKWSGIAYTGTNPITLNVNRYSGTTYMGTTVVATSTSPATNQVAWLNWLADYTTPAGCDQIKFSFKVAPTVTAGQIWFDDASLQKVIAGLPQHWIFDLIPDLSDVRNFINDVIDTVITVVSGIPFVGGTLANLLSWLTDWFDDTTYTAAQAGDALMIATTVEPIVYNTVADVDVVQLKAIAQQNYSISSVTDSPRKASWECAYPIADVSFPEAWINRTTVFGTTDGPSAGTGHTHTLSFSGAPVYASTGGYILGNGNCRGVFLTMTNTNVFDHMRLYAWCPVGTATDVTYSLHRVRADGSSYELVTKQIASQLTTSSGFIDVDLGGTLIVQAGEVYLLRVTNRSAANIAISAVIQSAGISLNGFSATGLTLGNATSYTAAQITSARNSTVEMSYGGLFRSTSFYTPKTYTDDFNRPDFGALWIPWANSGGGIANLRINFANGQGRAAFTGTVDGDESNVYMYPSASDQTVVAADTWGLSGTARCGIFCHASREANQLAYLGVSSLGANLYAGTWGTLGAAKATIPSSAVDGTNWGVYVDPTGLHNVFHIMKDNTDVASWTDSTDIMKIGSDFRYGGKIVSRISGVNAGEIDNWTMKDVA